VLAGWDGQAQGLLAVADVLRPGAQAAVSQLQRLGLRPVLLTGDNERAAGVAAAELGIPADSVVAGVRPDGKVAVVRQFQQAGGRVAMVGDGINDSPALSFADVGIAMKHGAEVTHESADIILMEDSLWKLVQAVEISQGAVGLIRQNYAIVASLNTLALALALPGGLITPEITALISNGSAILASLNGIRPILRYQ
jgi:Cu2+-exporting ATPase